MCSNIFNLCLQLLLISQVSSNLLSEQKESPVDDRIECQDFGRNSACHPKVQPTTVIIDDDDDDSPIMRYIYCN
jgi:hypothetical protein